MIDRQTVERILDAARIEDVVGDFVTLKRRGVNYIGLCPFHDEKTGSFIVSPAKGIYKCFGCGKAGGAVHFIMEHEQLSYPDALRYLARKYNIPIVETEQTEEERQHQSDRESMFTLNQWAQTYFVNKMTDTPDGRAIGLSYFRERGFTDEIIKKFGLGYCPDTFDHTSLDALKAGYSAEFIEKTGLGIKRENGTWYDRFRGRVMFPVHTLSGKVVAFGGRVLKKSDNQAKYVNSPESEIYHKSNELYGIYFSKQSIVKADRCILVEGYTDVISMHQSGVTNVVASSGTSLTPGQIRLIHRFTSNITVLYDGDSAGIKASIRGIDLLLEEGMNVKVVLLPDGDDPDSFAQLHDASEFIDFIDKNQVDFIHFKINLLMEEVGDDPIKRSSLISDVTRSVALIPDNITRSVYVHETALAFGIEEQVIAAEVKKVMYDKRQKELARKANGDFTPYHYSTDDKRTTEPVYRQNSPSLQAVDNSGKSVEQKAQQSMSVSKFDVYEQNILRFIVRNGDEVMSYTSDGLRVTVVDFIADAISELSPTFYNPLHLKLFEVARKADFSVKNAATYFRDYPDEQISALAAELLADRHQLSALYTKQDEFTGDPQNKKEVEAYKQKAAMQHHDQLCMGVSAVVHEYKLAISIDVEREVDKLIREAEKNGKKDELFELIHKKMQLKRDQKVLSDVAGGVVVFGPHKK